MTLRIDGIYGDQRGGHITVHHHDDEWIAVYHHVTRGRMFPCGFGSTEQEATRDLWRALHG